MSKWSWDKILDDILNKPVDDVIYTTTKNPLYEKKYNGEKVLVVLTEMLKKYDYFEGMIIKDRAKNLRDKLLIPENMFYIDRDEAENNANYKQVIPYCLISRGDETFCYQRSKSGSENRLHDLWSLGVGGHVNPCDGLTNESITNACKRELEEEVSFSNLKNAGFVGLINDDSDSVNSVHFGIVYHVKLNENSYFNVKEDALSNGSFLKTAELKNEYKNWEKWSNLILEEYLKKI